jgi:hypothetical protein
MRMIAAAVVLLLALPAWPQTLECYDSERFGNILINVGDSERRVLEQNPDRTVRLENVFGATRGWRYDFYKRKRTIQIYVRHGVVYRICRVPE